MTDIPIERLRRMLEVAQTVADDCEADATKYEYTAFTGGNVAIQLGEMRAQTQALAKLIGALLEERLGNA